MHERQRRQDLLEERDRIAAIEQSRVGRQSEPVVMAADKIESERVKGADPELRREVGQRPRQAFG